MTRPSRTTLARLLGGGTLAFGVLGVTRPAVLAAMLDADEDAARTLGLRDLGSGLALLATAGGDPRAALAQRVLFDVGDAAVFGRRRPLVAVAALSFAAVCALALAAE